MLKLNHTGFQKGDRLRGLSPFLLCILDLVLLNVAFFALNYGKRGTLDLSSKYVKLLLLFHVIWFVIAVFTQKFKHNLYGSYWNCIALYVRSGLYGAYCAAFIVVMFGLSGFSRLHVFGTWALLAIQEGIIFTLYYAIAGKGRRSEDGGQRTEGRGQGLESSRFLLVADFVLVGISFFLVNYLKRGNFYLLPEYEKLLLIIFGLWFGTSLATRKYVKRHYQSYYHGLWPWIKTAILMVAVMSVVVFGLRIFYFSRTQVFGAILVLVVLETVLFCFYFLFGKSDEADHDIESVEELKAVLGQSKLPAEVDPEEIKRFFMAPVRRFLKEEVLKDDPCVFAMLDRAVNLDEIPQSETAILNHCANSGFEKLNVRPLKLFINLCKINDIRWLNRYFLSVYESLGVSGYFFGKAHTIRTHKSWIFKKYPKQMVNGIYLIDFLINRICPKLPFTKRIYFALTKGKGRVMSKAEVLGRLCYCGFEIMAEKEIHERLYFLARKAKTVSIEQNPSYGLLVEFTRIGANNTPIRTYKFRTMHPYSEFLQDYVYSKSGLCEGGKIKDDFRITQWGKWMRKLWLDELPMLYNWVRGDLKLFGVRPLSIHYLRLYPKDLQTLREKVKPGLVPPFYADLPKTFEEICESEKKYIQAYLKHRFKTQWVYFGKSLYNIIVKGARSG